MTEIRPAVLEDIVTRTNAYIDRSEMCGSEIRGDLAARVAVSEEIYAFLDFVMNVIDLPVTVEQVRRALASTPSRLSLVDFDDNSCGVLPILLYRMFIHRAQNLFPYDQRGRRQDLSFDVRWFGRYQDVVGGSSDYVPTTGEQV